MNDQEFKDMFDRVIGPALEAEILERMAKATKDAIEQHYHATSIGEFAPREARPQ